MVSIMPKHVNMDLKWTVVTKYQTGRAVTLHEVKACG